jgi:glycosyltransferase involved in cell wall biosynthesis
MKILFFATYPTQAIGYARVGSILTNHLAEKHDVYYFGISNFKEQTIPREIHPKITMLDALERSKAINSPELYGVDTICDAIKEIQPDMVFLYNDVIVISRIFNKMVETKLEKKFKTITYLDLVYDYEKIAYIEHVNNHSDIILVFTEHWRKNLMSIGVPNEKIKVLPHGFDDKFKPMDPILAKTSFGLQPDDFLILNTNRNSYRKAIDITIEAFVRFLKKQEMNPKIKLFLNMLFQPNIGYDILNLVRVSCLENGVDYGQVVMNHILKANSKQGISDELLNKLYNAADIGLNTCVGEGFGLCNLEHGVLGKPQIVSKVGGLQDIFDSQSAILIKPVARLYVCDIIDNHGGYIYITDPEDFALAMEQCYKNRDIAAAMGKNAQKKILMQYNWENILSFVNSMIDTL